MESNPTEADKGSVKMQGLKWLPWRYGFTGSTASNSISPSVSRRVPR
jgi:hypothetical protein